MEFHKVAVHTKHLVHRTLLFEPYFGGIFVFARQRVAYVAHVLAGGQGSSLGCPITWSFLFLWVILELFVPASIQEGRWNSSAWVSTLMAFVHLMLHLPLNYMWSIRFLCTTF